jgi:hypothetical protein
MPFRPAVALLAAVLLGAAAPPPPRLLVLGMPHFDNPARDIVNAHVEDVLTPARQREIERVVTALARTRPTHVAVEWPASAQAALDRRYADYRAGRYALRRDEVDQIGMRLAARLGLSRVDAVDWNEEPPGRDEDYDFVAWANAHGRGAEFAAANAAAQARTDRETALNRCRPVADWLRALNTPAYRAADDQAYFRIATFGDARANPGAAWVGAWHARNLRIAAMLREVAGRPGERTVAIFGAGHAGLLRDDAAGMGFAVGDVLAVLPPPARPAAACRG